MANRRPVTSTTSVKTFAIEVESRYAQVAAMRITAMMTLPMAGVLKRRLIWPRTGGSTRWLAIP